MEKVWQTSLLYDTLAMSDYGIAAFAYLFDLATTLTLLISPILHKLTSEHGLVIKCKEGLACSC